MAGSYSYRQMEQLWLAAGGPRRRAPLMAAIAMAESGGDPKAYNSSGASGLWQILGAPANWHGSENWFDPMVNARAAVAKYRTQGLGAWTTYTSGAYKKFLEGGKPPSQYTHGGMALVDEAKKFIGTPYVWGGSQPGGFDCSGLVQYSLEKIGVKNPPRTSEEQWGWVKRISRSQLRPGDLIFEQWPGEASPGHVAIYAGNNKIIQAPAPGQDVQEVDWSPALVHQEGGQIVGYGRVPGIGGGSFKGGGGGGGNQQGGGIYTTAFIPPVDPIVTPIFDLIQGLGGASGIAQAFGTFSNNLAKVEHYVAWFFLPSHWVRIFAGLFGVGFTMHGIFLMARTGRAYSVDVPVVGSVPAAGGQIAPAIGIAEVTVGAILLFIAFHNLPANVTQFAGNAQTPGETSLLTYLQGELQRGGKQA